MVLFYKIIFLFFYQSYSTFAVQKFKTMNDNRDALDFSNEPVKDLFRKMFFPTLVGMVSMVILNLTDGAFVGHGVGSDALAAINIVAPIFLITGGLGLMFGIGSSVVASIHLSKGNSHAANLNITQGVLASIFVGFILGAIFLLFPEKICMLFGSSEALIPLACSYMKWIALLTPFNMFGMTGMFMVRLDGHPRFAGIMNSACAFLNIILDYILIFPYQMGIEGAAIASFVAFALGNIPLSIFLFTQTSSVHFCRIKLSKTSLYLSARNIAYQIKIGASALLGELAIASIMIVGNYVFMHYLGEDGVAAYSVGCYCLPIVFMIGNAIIQSVQPILSFAHGSNNTQRLMEAKKIALQTTTIVGFSGMILLYLGSGTIASGFLDSECNAYELCKNGLEYFSPAFLFIAINIVLIGYLQSIEEAKAATIFTLLRGFIFSIPCFILLPKIIGTSGLWLSLPLAECVTMVLLIIKRKK